MVTQIPESIARPLRPSLTALGVVLRIAGTLAVFGAYLAMQMPLLVLFVNRKTLFPGELSAYVMFMIGFVIMSELFCWALMFKLIRGMWRFRRGDSLFKQRTI